MKTILIMEDNAHQSRLMRRLLEHAGYVVLEAADGESGLHRNDLDPGSHPSGHGTA